MLENPCNYSLLILTYDKVVRYWFRSTKVLEIRPLRACIFAGHSFRKIIQGLLNDAVVKSPKTVSFRAKWKILFKQSHKIIKISFYSRNDCEDFRLITRPSFNKLLKIIKLCYNKKYFQKTIHFTGVKSWLQHLYY